MGKKVDLTGRVFGRLTVLEDAGRSKDKQVIWKCQCSCGNITNIGTVQLKSGKTKSCGCYAKERTSEIFRKDLTGQVFGRLTVLEDVGRSKDKQVIWKCQCECGNTVDVRAGGLQSGQHQSCGCLRNEKLSQRVYVNLVGQKFGRLTVLEDVGRNKQKKVIWKCQCECGNTVDVPTFSLRNGSTKSCGCYHREQSSECHYKDLTGQVFGRLTVLEDVGRNKQKKVIWKCLCDCGNTVDVMAGNLQRGTTQSCGCYRRERLSEIHSGENSHFWKGGITPLCNVIRTCIKYEEWRTQVFQRDSYICQHCMDKRGGKLHAHHIKFFSVIMEENHITTLEEAEACDAFWDVSNGITLCKKCHEAEHVRLRALDIPE